MSNKPTLANRARLSIEALAKPSELRQSHNFAASAQPIMRLDVSTTPPPIRQASGAGNAPVVAKPNPIPALVPDTDFLIETRLDNSDPPFRPPTSWHNASSETRPSPILYWSERSTAAFLGFAAGIMVIIPTVLFLSATSDRIHSTRPAETTPIPAIETVAVASAGHWFDTKNNQPDLRPQVLQSSRQLDHQIIADAAERRARKSLAEGRLTDARNTLRGAASPDTARLWFVLAETYDPLVAKDQADGIKQPGTSESLKAADIKFARYYYHQAFTYGVAEAAARLNTLAGR